MSAFFCQAFTSTEEERNATEAIAVYKESTRGKGFCCRFRVNIWLATVGNVFLTIDLSRTVLTTDKVFFKFLICRVVKVLEDLNW